MKKLAHTLLTLSAIFINSNSYALEARVPVASFSQALETAKNKSNFSTLKNAKYDVENKIYNITYLTKDGNIKSIKISQSNGKEVN